MKIEKPLWHRLLQPYFNWRADVREKKAAAKALKEFRSTKWEHKGYFNWSNEHVASAQESNKGKRRLVWLTEPEPNAESDLVVGAWLRGLPTNESHLWNVPRIPDAQMKKIRDEKKKLGEE